MARRTNRGSRTSAVLMTLFLAITVSGAGLIGWVATHQVSAPQAEAATTVQVGTVPGPQPAEVVTPTPQPSSTRSSTLPSSPPAKISIPAVGIHSRLQPLGLNRDGSLQVPAPPHYNEAGWYTGSPQPGQTGPAVILGHLDGVGIARSVFFNLGAVRPHDHVQITRADGRSLTFTVYRVKRYAKDDFPTQLVYGNTTDPELRLITCGGRIDPVTGHYQDDTVVFARLSTAR